jgi:phytanoyl-CoA hydroxylase
MCHRRPSDHGAKQSGEVCRAHGDRRGKLRDRPRARKVTGQQPQRFQHARRCRGESLDVGQQTDVEVARGLSKHQQQMGELIGTGRHVGRRGESIEALAASLEGAERKLGANHAVAHTARPERKPQARFLGKPQQLALEQASAEAAVDDAQGRARAEGVPGSGTDHQRVAGSDRAPTVKRLVEPGSGQDHRHLDEVVVVGEDVAVHEVPVDVDLDVRSCRQSGPVQMIDARQAHHAIAAEQDRASSRERGPVPARAYPLSVAAMSTASSSFTLPADVVETYRRDGFVHIPALLDPDEVARYRDAAIELSTTMESQRYKGEPFTQLVNVWQRDERIASLTMSPRIAELAETLAGEPLRLWHDQILIKQPRRSTATEFHLDAPYWPHRGASHWLTAWIALVDVPVERGCMTFLPGSHRFEEFAAVDLEDATALFTAMPELVWQPRVTVPLRAGDLTFHHGACAHAATPNLTDEPRVAHAIIYMDEGTRYSGAPHVVTDPLGLTEGDRLDGALFPRPAVQ